MGKKLLTALSILGTSVLLVVGATIAFFNDLEISQGNTFKAGNLDIKIDSTSHYNGFVCDGQIWICEPWADKVIDFEQGARKNGSPVPAERSDPTKALGEAENNDTINFFSLGFDVDMGLGGYIILGFDNYIINGPGNDIKIYETSYNSPSCAQYPEKAVVSVSQYGSVWDDLGEICVDAEIDMSSGSLNLPWARYVKIQDVTNPDDFGSNSVDGYDVDGVEALYCESVPDLEGQECQGTWEESDLGARKFFHLTDVKPADSGENTISVHIYDNDAWARVVLDNIADSDEGCSEPEVEEDEDCEDEEDEGGKGELSEHLLFSLWMDDGVTPGFQGKTNDFGEGDNIKQEAEFQLAEPSVLNGSEYVWNFWELLAALRQELGGQCAQADPDGDGHTNYGVCHGLAEDGRLVGSCTYYFGIDWQLPAATGNIVQGDSLTADLKMEAVQHRNNPDRQF